LFDQLFERPRALARHRDGPLAEERLRYLSHLASQGMVQGSLRAAATYLLVIADRLRLADRPDEAIALAEIQQQATLWADRPANRPSQQQRTDSRKLFLCRATGWLRFLGRLHLPPARSRPYADQIDAFAVYLVTDQGLSQRTRQSYCLTVEQFLDDLCKSGHSLEGLTITQVDEALIERITRHGYARRTVRDETYALRAFFRYAHKRGWCRSILAEAIQAPRVFTDRTLPSGPSWADVQRLLATTEGDEPKAIRDRPILLLLAVYGLRAGEVTRLRLEDFDWERELLSVTRSKSQRSQLYPLSRPIGDAVLRYLREGRPRTSFREVFLTLRAPIRPVSQAAVTSLVSSRLRPLGVTLPHYGAHALRHACATHLLSEGLSLKEIGDHLGHQHPDATRAYAKVDLAGLRQVADFDLGGLQ
jgi:site-specific recombinase XerD